MHGWWWRTACGGLGVVLLAAGCGGKVNGPAGAGSARSCTAASGRITIATANVGTPFYGLGGGIAQLISARTPLRATAAETAGSQQNLQLLGKGTYDLGFSLGDNAGDAVAGRGAYAGRPIRVRALARLYPAYVQVLVRTGSGITSFAGLRGKRISTGAPKSGSEVLARKLLATGGLNPDTDVTTVRLDLTKAAESMKNGSIDALIWSAGLPIAQITDLVTELGGKVRFLDATSQLAALQATNSAYRRGAIPAAVYHQKGDVPAIEIPNLLLARQDFPANDACAITKLIFQSRTTLARIHPVAQYIDLAKARELGDVRLHPGADLALRSLGG